MHTLETLQKLFMQTSPINETLAFESALTEVLAERDALALDAARYRWLRDVPWGYMPEMVSVIQLQQNSKWDAAIDAARSATP